MQNVDAVLNGHRLRPGQPTAFVTGKLMGQAFEIKLGGNTEPVSGVAHNTVHRSKQERALLTSARSLLFLFILGDRRTATTATTTAEACGWVLECGWASGSG